jgi:hypothetical protein
MRDRVRGRSGAELFCLLAGGLLVLRGLSVLVTGVSFGMPGEGWHAMFHLVSGALLLLGARGPQLAYRFVLGFAFAYGLVAIAGIVDGNDVFGVIPIDARDNIIHTAYVAVALVVVALGPPRTVRGGDLAAGYR